jgi:hypothetical protein
MVVRINNEFEQIDHKTCVSICDAVGERLQQRLRPILNCHRVCVSSSTNCAAATMNCIEGRRIADFADKWVAFGAGSGDNAACFPSRIFRSASPGGS